MSGFIEYLALALIIICVIISFGKYEHKVRWLFFFKRTEEDRLIQPGLNAMIIAVLIATSFSIRGFISLDNTISSPIAYLTFVCDIWYLATCIRIFTYGDDKKFMGLNTTTLAVLGIFVSFVGMQSVARLVWYGVILLSLKGLTVLEESLKLRGTILILFGFLSIVLQQNSKMFNERALTLYEEFHCGMSTIKDDINKTKDSKEATIQNKLVDTVYIIKEIHITDSIQQPIKEIDTINLDSSIYEKSDSLNLNDSTIIQ